MFLPFKTILDKRVRQYSFWQEILGFRICQLWQEETKKILGERIFKNAQPIRFQNGILEAKVYSPILSQELRLHEEVIKKKINSYLKEPLLKRIIYKTSKI